MNLALIRAIRDVLAPRPGSRVVRWIGDDAAVVRAGGYAAVSTDVMVDGTHFRLGQATPEDVGWRALAGALSDVAAMGAEPARRTCRWCCRRHSAMTTSSPCIAARRRWPPSAM